MSVSFEQIEIGREYDRPELAETWGYKSYRAIAKGVVTPKNTNLIILFITKKKQQFLTQYNDRFDNGVLEIEGEKEHGADRRIIDAEHNGDEIHLFFREVHHSPFVYCGRMHLSDFTQFDDKPSQFRFIGDRDLLSIDRAIEAESLTHGVNLEEFVPDPEGRERITRSIRYERSRKNRKKAIEIHGDCCVICGFDFDAFYGAEFGQGFIEVHHTEAIAASGGQTPNVETDLVPVCSNCHSVLHKRRDSLIPVDILRQRVNEIRNQQPRPIASRLDPADL